MFKLEIETDNAAFNDGDNGRTEISRILRLAAVRVEQGGARQWPLVDTNDNTVGKVHFHS